MATNPYFSSNYFATTKDQVLTESLIIESIKIYGVDVYYLPRTLVNYDTLFGEDHSSSFDDAYTVEMYIKNVDGFGGDGSFLSKFGLEIRDEVSVTVSINRFEAEVTANDPTLIRPREGDIIFLPTVVGGDRPFEISFVEQEEVFWQQGALHTYEIRARLFEYGGEEFNTGITNIDAVDDVSAQTYEYTLEAGIGSYALGETVIQANGIEGEVLSFADPVLTLIKVKGELNYTDPIVGQTSLESRLPLTLDSGTNNDTGAQNEIIEEADDTLIDFSESNPFSEI